MPAMERSITQYQQQNHFIIMGKRMNRYEGLRKPGVRGQVVARDYRSHTLYDTLQLGLVLLTGELLPGVWDYGYMIHRDGKMTDSRLPGEGSGWFKTEKDAKLYGLDEIRQMFDFRGPEVFAIDNVIRNLTTTTLF